MVYKANKNCFKKIKKENKKLGVMLLFPGWDACQGRVTPSSVLPVQHFRSKHRMAGLNTRESDTYSVSKE